MSRLVVELTDWAAAHSVLSAIRTAVFVHEQEVPAHLEWDEFDAGAVHVLARVDARAVGTARLVMEPGGDSPPLGRVGRMAVLKDWRGRGVGGAMLVKLIEYARQQRLAALYLHAQTHALAFYARHGFISEGKEFMEVSIPHRSMRLMLNT